MTFSTADIVTIIAAVGAVIVNIIKANKTAAVADAAKSTADNARAVAADARSTAVDNHAESLQHIARLDAFDNSVGVATINALHNSVPVAALDMGVVLDQKPPAPPVAVDVNPH